MKRILKCLAVGTMCLPPQDGNIGQEEHSCLAKAKEAGVSINAGKETGSGIVVRDNFVVTANHTLNSKTICVKIIEEERCQIANILARDPENDIAILSTDTKGIVPIPFTTQKLQKGDPVFAIGHPLGNKEVANPGNYKGIWGNGISTSSSVNYGQSGGGLITCNNGTAYLAGMTRAFVAVLRKGKLVRRNDLSVATPVKPITRLLETIEKKSN